MKSTLRLGLVLLLLSGMRVSAQQSTPVPTPAAAPRDKSDVDPLTRSRKEPSKEEQARTKTGKGATPGKDEKEAPKGGYRSETFAGLELRSIGPALTSGRITDLAVDPENKHRWFVASADGGVWRTVNSGVTFQPVFDGEVSHSIGCVTIDPNDPFVIWVGSGENNSQRVVIRRRIIVRTTAGRRGKHGEKPPSTSKIIAIRAIQRRRVRRRAALGTWRRRRPLQTTDGGRPGRL